MAIKDFYKEKEDDDTVTMSIADFVKEHKKLIKILRKGSRQELDAEADSQEAELADQTEID